MFEFFDEVPEVKEDHHMLVIAKTVGNEFIVGEFCSAVSVIISPVIINGNHLDLNLKLISFMGGFDDNVTISAEDMLCIIPLDLIKYKHIFEKYKEYRNEIENPLPENDEEELITNSPAKTPSHLH